MRILQVMAGAEKGGAETAFVDMVLALNEAGAEQHVVTRANDLRVPKLIEAGIQVTTLPFGGGIDVYTPWRIKKIIRDFAPDIVQTWMARAASKTPAWNGRGKRYLKVARLGGYYKLKYFKGTDHFTTITPMIRDYLVREGVAESRVTHINNFAEMDAPRETYSRADYQTPGDAPLAVVLGRLHPAKAIDTFLRALGAVPGLYAWIGGDGPERNALLKLVEDLGIKDRVRFVGWVDDRAAFLRAGDFCVFPSRYEPFGTVFVQAWAAGVPLITSDADGPRQYVQNEKDALVFPIDDVQSLANAMKKLISDKALGEKVARAGRMRYQNEFTKEKTVTAYLNLYAALLSGEASRAVAPAK